MRARSAYFLRSTSSYQRGFSPIVVTATLSLVALLAVTGWQIDRVVRNKNVATSYVAKAALQAQDDSGIDLSTFLSDSAEVGSTVIGSTVLDGLIGKYNSLQAQGIYTEEVGEKVAEKMAATLTAPVAYRTYAAADVTTVPDTSYERMLAYRSDLQTSLSPLLKNTQAEFEIFAYYVKTNDASYLTELREVAENYRAAIRASVRVVVPKDAQNQHLGILNAMEEFAATLDAMAANADDPFAAVTLLRTYNQAEQHMFVSYKLLADYYRQKKS